MTTSRQKSATQFPSRNPLQHDALQSEWAHEKKRERRNNESKSAQAQCGKRKADKSDTSSNCA